MKMKYCNNKGIPCYFANDIGYCSVSVCCVTSGTSGTYCSYEGILIDKKEKEQLTESEKILVDKKEYENLKKREEIFYESAKRWTSLGDYYQVKELVEKEHVILPFKVGTEVFSSEPFKDGVKRKGAVIAFEVDKTGVYGFWAAFDTELISAEFVMDNVGKTVFLTGENQHET